MKRTHQILLPTILAAASVSVAAGATLTATCDPIPSLAACSVAVTGTNTATLNVQKFNPSVGTLTGITVTTATGYVIDLTVTNAATNTTDGLFWNAKGSGSMTLTGPSALSITSTAATATQGSVVSKITVHPGTPVDFPTLPAPSAGTVAGTQTFTTAADLANYTGAGTAALTLTGNGYAPSMQSSGATPGGLGVAATGTGTTAVTVTYTFTPAPPDLTILKTASPTTIRPGDNVTFTLTPQNIAGTASTGTITVVDTLPAGMSNPVFTGTNASWTCGTTGGTVAAGLIVTCTSSAVIGASTGTPVAAAFPILLTATSGATPATLNNNVTVSGGGQTDTGCGGNDCASANVTVIAPDLKISKSHPAGTYVAGSTVTYTITPSNNGPLVTADTLGTITVSETIPNNFTVTSITGTNWACPTGAALAASPLVCTSTTVITNGSTGNPITLVGTINAGTAAGTAINNSVTISGGGEPAIASYNNNGAGNNTATDTLTVASVPDLKISKTHPAGTYVAGSTVTYTITPGNNGPLAAADTTGTVTVSETIPNNFTVTSITGSNWTCPTGAALATSPLVCTSTTVITNGTSGNPITLVGTINAGTAAGTVVNNSVTISGGGEPNLATFNNNGAGNNTATDTLTVASLPDLKISKSHPAGTYVAGSTVTYTITPGNNGPLAAADTTGTVTVSETIPNNFTVTSITGSNWTCPTGAALATSPLVCTSTTVITNGTSGNPITLVGTINAGTAAGTAINNSVTISGGGEPAIASYNNNGAGNNTATDTLTVASVPDLKISKSHPAGAYNAGSTVTYTITPSNNGPLASADTTGTVTVSETIPNNFTVTSITGTNWDCPTGAALATSPLVCTSSTVMTNGTAGNPITLIGTINAGTAAGTVVNNSVTISGGGEPNLASFNSNGAGNNTATDTLTVASVPDLKISKSHPAGTYVAGSTVTYTITPSNNGPLVTGDTLGTITVSETIPNNFTVTSITGTNWTCPTGAALATSPLLCTSATVITNGSTGNPITLVGTINAGTAAGTAINNSVTISGGGEPAIASYNNNGAGNNTATDTLTVASVPDLKISKSHPAGTYNAGSTVTYTITPSNNGPLASADTTGTVTVSETIPNNFTVTSITGTNWTCPTGAALATSPLVCTSTTVITNGTSGNPITLVGTINAGTAAGTVVNNSVTISGGGEPNLATFNNNGAGNNTATDTLTVASLPDLKISKTHPAGTYVAGSTVTYTITPANNGPLAAADTTGTVTVSETIPNNFTVTSITGTNWTCPTGAALATSPLVCTSTTVITNGSTGNPITLVGTINAGTAAGTAINNSVTISGGGEPAIASYNNNGAGNNTATDTLTVASVPDLKISKSHPAGTYVAGSTVTYTITPSNNGPLASADTTGTVTVSETIPNNFTVTSITGLNWDCPTGAALATSPLVCASSTVMTNGTAGNAITLVGTINAGTAAGTVINNSVTISGGGEPAIASYNNNGAGNNTATDTLTVASVPDLIISKTASGTNFTPGQTVTYTLTPKNIGGASSGNIVVTDTLPPGLTFTAGSFTGTNAAWGCTGGGAGGDLHGDDSGGGSGDERNADGDDADRVHGPGGRDAGDADEQHAGFGRRTDEYRVRHRGTAGQ